MRRRLLLGLGLTAVVSALSATSCLSPTLPLPPPDVEAVSQSTEPDRWLISGTCAPGALVIVFNDDTAQGVAYEDRDQSGHFLVEIEAELCDSAWVSQERGNDTSARNFFVIDAFSINDPNGSGACQ